MSAIPPRGARWFTIPAGAAPATCKGHALGGQCVARIYWVRTPLGILAVDADIAGARRPSEARNAAQFDLFTSTAPVHDGKGIAHNDVCPDRRLFALVRAS